MVFDNPTHGYLVGSKDGMSTILETNDSGATWNQVNSNFDGEFLSIVKIDNTNFIIGGSNGTLLKWDATIPTSNIYNNTHNNSFTASPNPTKGNLKIDFPDNIISANVAVVNSSGQVVYIEDNAHEPIEINLNKYPNGNYYIIFKYKNKLSSKKIVVKH
jgi:ligand-binding sensor domain-containing protein